MLLHRAGLRVDSVGFLEGSLRHRPQSIVVATAIPSGSLVVVRTALLENIVEGDLDPCVRRGTL
jgi:hypothetical protein